MGKTLLEISKEIGVSTATISRVLTGEDCVSPETREKVLRAVEASGYRKRPRRRSDRRACGNYVECDAEKIRRAPDLPSVCALRCGDCDSRTRTCNFRRHDTLIPKNKKFG